MHITLSQNSCIYDGRISTASISVFDGCAAELNSDCISLFDGLGTAVDKQVFISHAFQFYNGIIQIVNVSTLYAQSNACFFCYFVHSFAVCSGSAV